MLALFLAIVASCTGGDPLADDATLPDGPAIAGRLFFAGDTEVAVEAQLFSDGSMTVSGSDGATSLDLTVLDASSATSWSPESTDPSPVALSFSHATANYTVADTDFVGWSQLEDGKYEGYFNVANELLSVQIGPTHPADFHCLSGEEPGGSGQRLYCEEQTIEQFHTEVPEGGCWPWRQALCPTEQMLGFCEADDGDGGSYFLEGVCELLPEPAHDGSPGVSTPEELCTDSDGIWTAMGEGSCG